MSKKTTFIHASSNFYNLQPEIAEKIQLRDAPISNKYYRTDYIYKNILHFVLANKITKVYSLLNSSVDLLAFSICLKYEIKFIPILIKNQDYDSLLASHILPNVKSLLFFPENLNLKNYKQLKIKIKDYLFNNCNYYAFIIPSIDAKTHEKKLLETFIDKTNYLSMKEAERVMTLKVD